MLLGFCLDPGGPLALHLIPSTVPYIELIRLFFHDLYEEYIKM